ncbi:DNA primase [Aedoeadaptatus ivorii]|uniref:DNA primase n=1 Tax=Aedoeadaptatus ivorii TaxID=54006 RepID=A0A448V0V0_9FIRM|nr:DNA primase [Peptoniphilus ivorii]VEJ35267.1 DNA primase [Peptoniphilus ivorii]
MASIIDDDIIARVKEESDIVEWIGRYTKLEKKGRNYMGLCPFHSEKTPSFSVQPEKGYYHCFGCGAGGDIINFLMEKEGLGFIDAVEKLAESLHIELRPATKNPAVEEKNRRIFAANREAAVYYMKILSRNKYALAYLNGRGIGRDTILAFGLGFAPAGGDQLLGHMKRAGFSEALLYEANLLSRNRERNNYFDRFRNRIIFPIVDTKSRVVGFGGRVLDDSKPKYLNSSDTPVYKKSRELYGLNRVAKTSDREKILLVEGYMDVISLHASGISYAVASLGTSLTTEQARRIKRFGKQVYICYDADEAGRKATNRAIDILLKEDVRPRIVLLERGADPDDYIREHGKIAFEAQLARGVSAPEYQVEILEESYNLHDAASLSEFLREVTKVIEKIPSPVERDVYAKKFAERYGVRSESFRREMGKFTHKREDLSRREKQTDSERPLWTQLLLYALEQEDFYDIAAKNDAWQWVVGEADRHAFDFLGELYQEGVKNGTRRVRFLDAYPTYEALFMRSAKSLDLQRGEEIVRELAERLYEEGLRNRSEKLLSDIQTIEKEGTQSGDDLRQKLQELTEINRRLHELEKGEPS